MFMCLASLYICSEPFMYLLPHFFMISSRYVAGFSISSGLPTFTLCFTIFDIASGSASSYASMAFLL